MEKITRFLIEQKLLVNLSVFLIVMIGIYMAFTINREAIPEVNFDMVSIETIYPGGSPEEIEQLITIPIEQNLREVLNIDRIRAYSLEHISVIVVFIEDRARDKPGVVQDIKDAVEMTEDIPSEAERPIVKEIKFDKTNAIDVALFSENPDEPYSEIRDAAKELEYFLYEIRGVAEVEKFGYYDREYLISVDPGSLKKNHLGINTIVNTLETRNLDFPGGVIRQGDLEYILRTKGQFKNVDEIRNTIIRSNDLGHFIRLGDVATVTETFEEPDIYERFNGREAVILNVWKTREADEIDLVDTIREKLAEYEFTGSDTIALTLFNDTSRYTRDSLDRVSTNAFWGFLFLAAILFLMLGFRTSSIVSISIPVSLLVAFIGLRVGDITLNIISMFGMIMVLGMIVDFAIVVSENSQRYLEAGWERKKAIEQGVKEIFWPITVTLICICSVFTPLLFLSGIMGKFIIAIPLVIIISLIAAWFIAMFAIPTYLHMFMRIKKRLLHHDTDDPVLTKGFFRYVQRAYKKLLSNALRFRYITFAVLILLLTGSLLLADRIGFIFSPPGGEEDIHVMITLPSDTNLMATYRMTMPIEEIALSLPEDELDSVHTRIGVEGGATLDPTPGDGTNKSTLLVRLTPADSRERSAHEINAALRQKMAAAREKGIIPDEMLLELQVSGGGPPVGKPVNVEIRGRDFHILEKIANEYTDFLEKIEGTYDVRSDLEDGKPEIRYSLIEETASRAGITMRDIAMTLNASFEGAIATSIREGDEEIKLRVRFDDRTREQRRSLNEVVIENRAGALVPLKAVTRATQEAGYVQINRLNSQRLVQVTAELDTDVITSVQINRKLAEKFSDIEERYPGYSVSYGGEQEDTEESMAELGVLFIFALLFIFIVLAVFFNSLILPLVVMSAIPFSLVGVIPALWIHGQPMSFMSTLGVFSLAGVIVSNTLVLVQFINNNRYDGRNMKESLIEAGVVRLRPVLLTTGTTVLALIPTIYGLGGKDYFVAPLALAFGYGLIFATLITLVLIPSFYHIAEDIKQTFAAMLSFIGINADGRIYKGHIIDKSS